MTWTEMESGKAVGVGDLVGKPLSPTSFFSSF